MRPTVALLVLLLAFSFAGSDLSGRTPAASAHALLVSAEPPVNASVQEAPRELTLWFSEPLERRFSTATVTDQDGDRLDEGVAFDDGDAHVMRVSIAAAGPGYFVVSWETVSAVDGHRITGSYPVTVLNPDGSAPAVAPPAAVGAQGDEARPGFVVSKFLSLAAGSALAGALLFMLWVSPAFQRESGEVARNAADRRAAIAALVALTVIAIAGGLELIVQASNIGSAVGDVLDTRWGERWLLRNACYAVALAAVLALLLRPELTPRARRVLVWVALLATAGAFVAISSTSHAAAGEGAFWAAATDFVHLFAASVWIGMLAMLGLLFVWARKALDARERHVVLSTGLQRFSLVAVLSLALLIITGTVSAVIEVGRIVDLVESAYGRTLLLKLALLLPLLAVGAYNAYVLRPGYVGAPPAPETALATREQRLTRTIRFEVAIALAVFAVVGVLVQVTPTRAGASQQPAEPFAETRSAEGIAVTLAVDPNLPGINAFDVSLSGIAGAIEQVRLEFFDRSGATSESRLELTELTPQAEYGGQGPFLSTAGAWQVRVNLRQSQGSDLSVPFEVAVGGSAAVRGGAFASPVDWSSLRVALIALAVGVAVTVMLVSLRSNTRKGGHVGQVLRRPTVPKDSRDGP